LFVTLILKFQNNFKALCERHYQEIKKLDDDWICLCMTLTFVAMSRELTLEDIREFEMEKREIFLKKRVQRFFLQSLELIFRMGYPLSSNYPNEA